MKLITFNINGIRSGIKKGIIPWLLSENPDILCLQEIKLSETDLVEDQFKELGYECFWHPAKKRGYSGVATLTKISPVNVYYTMGNDLYDDEGRSLIMELDNVVLINTYFPSGSSGEARQEFKYKFLKDYTAFINTIKKQGKPTIICGDVNICHQEIDIHNPKSNKNTSGFLPEEREWVSNFLAAGYVDAFRKFNTDPHHYTWWTYRAGARQNNKGWRIDYFFVDQTIENKIKSSHILSDVVMSDHCPVTLNISI